MKKIISSAIASAMLISSLAAFAEIPDINISTIDNAAVVAKNGVSAHQSMNIEGDVYSGGVVEFDNAGQNFLDGNIISSNSVVYPSEPSSAILQPSNRQGTDAIENNMSQYLDQYFSDAALSENLSDNSVKPEAVYDENAVYTKNVTGWFSLNSGTFNDPTNNWAATQLPSDENGVYYYTVSENTSFENLTIQNIKLLIDATENPVYLKITNSLTCNSNGYIEVMGSNPVYLIAPPIGDIRLNVTRDNSGNFDFGSGNVTYIVTENPWEAAGSVGKDSSNSMICANIFSDTGFDTFTVNTPVKGNIVTNAASVYFQSQADVTGDIYAYGETEYYFDGKITGNTVTSASKVTFKNSGWYNDERVTGNISAVNADSFDVSCSIVGNIATSANTFTITGGAKDTAIANIQGKVYAPNAAASIYSTSGNGINRGQLICDSLDIFGEGAVIWGSADNSPINATAAPEATATPEATAAPEATATPEATAAPEATATPDVVLPSGTEPQMRDFKYAYIFGYEPGYNEETGETIVEMAPNDSVTVEQVCAMIARTMSQIAPNELSGVNISDYPNINMTSGSWSAKGVAYLASKHAFDGIANVPYWAEITRGEVAKLIALGLNTDPVYAEFAKDFTDIENHIYKPYIDIVSGRGYMSGDGNGTFNPDRIMTRAEFCSLFNNITDRADYDLVDIDGNEVTPATYNIVDLDNAADWERQACMLATSAFVPTGYSMRIDLQVRAENIRNRLDDYNGQMEH